MKKRLYKVFSLLTILALMLAAVPMQSALAATSIAQWNFESPNPADALDAATYPNTVAPASGTGNAAGVHASGATDWSTPVGNGSTDSFSSNTWAVGDYYQFTVSTVGYTGIQVSWDQTSSGTGPRDFKLAYSTDGTNFTDFGSPYTVLANASPNPVWNSTTSSPIYTTSRDLSTVTAVNDQANVYFRLINISTTAANGTTVAAGGTNRVDNFTVSGTPIVVGDNAPTVIATSPTDGATNVAVNSNITVNFSENVDVAAGAVSVECPVGTPVAMNALADNVPSVLIDPVSDLPANTTCVINVTASGVTDEDANDPPDAMAANFSASFTTAAPTSTSEVVISQIYGGAGCGTAGCSTYRNDYIELYNRSANPVDITGWSVQYASATGTTWQTTPLSGSIAAGQYYLVQEGGNANGVNSLPTPNATGSINMSATAAKVALVNSTAALSGSCPLGGSTVDLVGYGATASCAEGGAPAPAPSTTTAIFRAGNGATDTDNNAADFATGAPNPRNTPPPNPNLTINDVSLSEGNSGTTTFAFTVSLSGPAPAGGVTFDITTADGTATVANSDYQTNSLTGQPISAGNSTYTFNVLVNGDAIDEGADETFFVNVTNVTGAILVDGQGQGTIVNDDVNVCTQTFTPIYTIQGSGSATTIPGNVTTQGVVIGDFETSAGVQGFYIQDATGDGNAATSDGLLVFTGPTTNVVNVGDVVRVTGYARERFTQTAIQGANDNNAAVPANNIVNCGTGSSVAVTDITMPFSSTTFLERYEGMYIRFPQSLVIAEYFNYDQFGEIVLALPLDGESRPFSGTAVDQPGAAANARTLANSLRRITLDDAQGGSNPSVLRHPNGAPFALNNLFRGGDLVANAVGVLGFDFSLYRIYPTGPADYTSVNARPVAPDPVGGDIRVAAMNTLNFFVTLDALDDPSNPDNPADNVCGGNANLDCRGADLSQPTEFTRQRDKLLVALTGLDADVIGLNELENTPGAEPLESIVSGMPGYDYIDTGTIGTDAIKVGIIYRPAVVTPIGSFQTLDSTDDPRFIDTRSRPSLAQTFQVNATGARFTVVVNHLKSKGSACSGDPDAGDGQGNCNGTRTLAAQALVDWLATDPTGSGDPDYLIMGDLNSYAMEDPITAIKAGADDTAGTSDDYTNLISHFHGPYAYSYTFDGQAGYLDHALANSTIFSQVTGAAEWHINSDEPDVLDYDTSFKPAAQEALYEVNQYRTSDHDAVVVGLHLEAPPAATNDSYNTNEDTTLTVTAPGVLGNDTDANNDALTAVLVSNTSNGTLSFNSDGSFSYAPNANFNGTDAFTYKANDGTSDSAVATVNITIASVNDDPVASNDSYSTNEDTALVVTAPGVLANDTDVDGAFTAVLVTGPSHGSLTLNSDGSFSYAPAANYNGSDSFTYKSNDGSADSNIATVSITVNAVNDAPVALNDSASVAKNGSVAIFILVNDSDVEGDTLTVTSFTQPSHGTVTYSARNRNFRYTPTKGFSGTDTFTYTISDGNGGTATATVTITVGN